MKRRLSQSLPSTGITSRSFRKIRGSFQALLPASMLHHLLTSLFHFSVTELFLVPRSSVNCLNKLCCSLEHHPHHKNQRGRLSTECLGETLLWLVSAHSSGLTLVFGIELFSVFSMPGRWETGREQQTSNSYQVSAAWFSHSSSSPWRSLE